MEKGFTLVELLVVIGIISLLTALILPNFRGGESQFALQRSANKLSQDIRRAQQMALSAKECQPCGGIFPETGYGIILDNAWSTRQYRLYADTHGKNEFFTPNDTIVETIDLEKGVIIKEISLPPNTYSSVSINFKPPDPITNIKYNIGPPGQSLTIITLALETDPNKTKTVKVNKAGLIYVE